MRDDIAAFPDLQTVARRLGGTINGDQVLAPGPGHSAADRSLSIKFDVGAPDDFIVHSFAGDDPIECKDYVRKKLGLSSFKPGSGERVSEDDIARAVMAAATGQTRDSKPKGKVVATFDYTDADGVLLYQVLKYDPKNFSQRRPDGNGGWIPKLADRRVIYRWPELLQYPDATVFICEGEKDADRVASLGHCATTVAHGKWTEECVEALHGRDCIILQDKDAKRGGEPGRTKALTAAQSLHGVAKSIRIVLLPGLNEDINDVSDWLDEDPRRAEKLTDISFAIPEWTPANDSTDTNTASGNNTETKPRLPFINMSNWDREPVPEQEWAVLDRIPLGQTTLFTGEGGYGKSTTALHLCAAHSLTKDWLNTLPEPGPAIFFEAEDGEKTIHRRLAAVAAHYGVTFEDMIRGGLHIVSLFGDDAALATPTHNGKIKPTQLYDRLLQAAGDIKPKMIGICSSANVFTGNENDRTQTQQFIGLLNRIAMIANGAVVLISHPSLTGISTDTGLSGTTQWHNAVRARFYLRGIKVESGEQPDNDLRELVFKKNQFGPMSANIVLRYRNGLFLPEAGVSGLDKIAREAKANEVFLDVLKRLASEGRKVSHKLNSPTYAPATFVKESEAQSTKLTKADLEAAMRRLFAAGKIRVETYGRPSRPYHHVVAC